MKFTVGGFIGSYISMDGHGIRGSNPHQLVEFSRKSTFDDDIIERQEKDFSRFHKENCPLIHIVVSKENKSHLLIPLP